MINVHCVLEAGVCCLFA